MNNAWKAALLSALVIPGLGQLVLKRSLRGGIMMTTVIFLLTAMSVKIIAIALAILRDVNAGKEVLNAADIAAIGRQAAAHAVGPGFSVLIVLLLACWAYSTIDAYLLGSRLDRNHPS